MKFSLLKASALTFAIATCLTFGSVDVKADNILSSTVVPGLSLTVEEVLDAATDTKVEDTAKNTAEETTGEDPLAAGATEVKEVTNIPEVKQKTKEKTVKKEETKEVSKYEKTAVAKVRQYLNIREKASEDAEIVGKLYKGAAGEVLKTKNGWTKIKSGSVTGWVKSDYIVTGDDAEAYANKVCDKVATVTTQTLKVREKASKKAKVLDLISEDKTYSVVKESENWVLIKLDDDTKGYVAKEFVTIDFDFEDAVSIEEEREAEEAAARAALEQAQQEQEESQAAQSSETTSNATSSTTQSSTSNASSSSNSSSSNSSSNSSSSSSTSSSSSSSSSKKTYNSAGAKTRQNVVNFALQFVGNPYVYGGTSLTNGADCSGFTQSVFKNFGVSISRTSSAQSTNGRAVALSDVQPGDLIFYANGGRVGHVAIYIGNGQVVHASTAKTGIKVSNMYYRTPYSARSVLD